MTQLEDIIDSIQEGVLCSTDAIKMINNLIIQERIDEVKRKISISKLCDIAPFLQDHLEFRLNYLKEKLN